MKVALCQIDTRVGDLTGNAARIVAAADVASAQGADLAVFPELALTGYPLRDLLTEPDLVSRTIHALREIARHTTGLSVVVGAPLPSGGSSPLGVHDRTGPPRLFNAAVLLQRGGVTAVRPKTLLPAYDVFHEPRWFRPARWRRPVPIAGRSVGLLVCEDLWEIGYQTAPARELRDRGADLLVALNASPFRKGIERRRHAVARRHTGVPLVYVNAVGAEDDLVFDGGSFALDAHGRLLARLPRFREAIELVDLSVERAPAVALPPADPAGDLHAALVLGVRDFFGKNGLREAFVGRAGGRAAPLVACVARAALGPDRVTAVAMPSRFTDPRSTESARALANALGIRFLERPIDALHSAALDAAHMRDDEGTAAENIQARLRALLLMAEVNRHGGALLNTSNKSELALGYGTLYGDLAGGLGVLADLTKTEVFHVARWVQRHHGHPIPRFTLERPPSAELRPDQIDPFDYARLDPVIEALVRGDGTAQAAAATAGLGDSELADLARRVQAAEHKRRQAPPGLKLTDCAFGPGRQMPITRAPVRVEAHRPASVEERLPQPARVDEPLSVA